MPLDVPMASFVPCMGLGALAMFGASFGIAAAFFLATASYVGWQSSITGGSYWEGFSSFITDNWSETLAITSATYIAAMSIRLVNSPKCFKEGTLVQTENGLKPIDEIQVGDKVLAYNEQTGEQAYKPVLRLFRNQTQEWYHILANGEEIVCTGGHPFYVADLNKFIPAKQLEVGTKLLLSSDKQVIIEKIEIEQLTTPETTYNFEVEDFHTYYVTESNVLVHNSCKYFEANKVDDEYVIGEEITKKQAQSRLRNGASVWAESRSGAKSLAKSVAGKGKVMSHNAHGIGYYKHFHDGAHMLNGAHVMYGNPIW